MSTLIGLDHGGRRIGVAVGDTETAMAFARPAILRHNLDIDLAKVEELAGEESAELIVIGLPLNMDGSDSPRTQSVRAFARNLLALQLPILLWDERWSTVAVERAMIGADMSRAKRATRIDAHAAAHILQGAIDALVNLPEPS